MRSMPKYDSAQLSLALYNKWGEVLNDSGGKIRFRDSELTREKTKVRFSFQGVDSIMDFRDSEKDESLKDFLIYFPRYGQEYIEVSAEALKKANSSFSDLERKTYSKIFGKKEPTIFLGNIGYDKQEYKNVLSIVSPIFEIPLGKNGGLSNNLFIYFRRGIFGPVHDTLQKFKRPYEKSI